MSAAAKVGTATRIMIEVVRVAHTNNEVFISGRSGCFIFRIVTIKLTAPKTDEIPRIFRPKIHISAAGPGALIIEYGGYAFQVTSENPSQTSAAPTGIIQNA